MVHAVSEFIIPKIVRAPVIAPTQMKAIMPMTQQRITSRNPNLTRTRIIPMRNMYPNICSILFSKKVSVISVQSYKINPNKRIIGDFFNWTP